MTTMIYFDTLHYVKTLKAAGISEKEAEAFAEAQQEALSECLDTTLATKSDLFAVKGELQDDITGLSSRVEKIESETKLLKWMITTVIAGVGALILKAFF